MSLFTDASLVMIPSGIKDQKVYSVTPTDGSGDLTFSRASNATRVNSSGLVEKVRENNVLYSQDFTSGWTNGNVTISTSATANPVDGQLTAQDIIPNTTLSVHRILRTAGYANSINTWSIYAKAKGYNFITLVENGNTGANVSFNLSTGVVSQQNSAVGQIQPLGGGWYRCSMIVTCTNTPRFDVYVSPTDSLSGYSGDGTSGVILFGAQAEQNDFGPTPYIATTSAAVSVGPVSGLPRLDYSGGASCPSLLLEPQRTNVVTYSEQFNNSVWIKLDTSATANAGVSPDGYTNADKIVPNTTNARHILYQSISTSATHTFSVFAKAAGQNFLTMRLDDDTPEVNVFFNLSTGTIGSTAGGSPTMTSYGNGWYRCSVTYTPSGTETIYAVLGTANVDGSISYSGNSTDGVLMWGAQLEAGAYATSYIPTLSSAVTRVGEASYRLSASAVIGQTEGTLFIDLVPQDISGQGRYLNILNSSTTNDGWISIIASGSNNWRFYGDGFDFSAGSITRGTRAKVALAYKNGVLTSAYVNGVSVGTLTANTTSKTYNQVQLGYGPFGNTGCNDTYQAIIFPTALSNAQLAELTA